jgi:transposase
VDLLRVLQDAAWTLVRVKAGPLWQWLFSALAEANLPVVCIETRHAGAYLKAQVSLQRKRIRRKETHR